MERTFSLLFQVMHMTCRTVSDKRVKLISLFAVLSTASVFY